MRVRYVVLLVVAVLASANATSFATQSKINSPSLLTTQHGVSALRFLRIHYTEEEDDNEARGIATVVEQAKAMLSSSKISQKTLERWVRNNKSPSNALIRLKLDKAGNKLFENPQFQAWAIYMTMLNKQNPEAAMISTLMTRYSDDVLSQMIIAAEKQGSRLWHGVCNNFL
ncbi:hypothetical protein PF005_g26020 [Phytophthora fragariae]|uniref:RxLR effector protein n=1 Tax=Phytophthora fragariae TaxID=53985 RepID=A0A6A3VP93_9STRA|nr:hypothetical protein PF003_g35586 [Phytophthora fragariae]KAE8919329.1 hypothetical protein PF009_g30361 [Phytophthora fragariae]KAE8962701.1 hypothetical protein PF011_g29284 [Phytophthora fragariae]KAE9062574.1 hypothetical protein PF007_g29861 [Phytophthora fragariae]KAE9072367.1 hypothetical protein PF010_g25512 [Phytophthora fragariae]